MADIHDDALNKSRAEAGPEVFDEAITKAMGGELTEEQQKLIEELDKETSVRKLANATLAKTFYLLCIAVSLYHFITSFIGTPVILKHRALHVAMMLVLTFILYPFNKKSSFKRVAWYDWIPVLLSLAAPLYIWFDYMGV
ncbi:MAG: C4-dicarboxylate ABC transporter permease, partial [Deltaproteobacteria bacterium]|nr:C4-dicarboxylate ABC transporter permease [Deltaproteobacteria bacterium]